MNRYENPWRGDTIIKRPQFYENDAPTVLTHRGVTVYRLHACHFDFVLDGMCITQRAGVTKAKEVIDGIFAGTEFVLPQMVADHIRLHGGTPWSE